MTRKYIPASEAFEEWRKDSGYAAEYNALEEEFALVSALIKESRDASLMQEQVQGAVG